MRPCLSHLLVCVLLIQRQPVVKVLQIAKPVRRLRRRQPPAKSRKQRVENGLQPGLVAVKHALQVREPRRDEEPHVQLPRHLAGSGPPLEDPEPVAGFPLVGPLQRGEEIRRPRGRVESLGAELRDHARRAARALQGPEELWTLGSGGRGDGAVGQDDRRADEPVEREALCVGACRRRRAGRDRRFPRWAGC